VIPGAPWWVRRELTALGGGDIAQWEPKCGTEGVINVGGGQDAKCFKKRAVHKTGLKGNQ